MSLIEKFPRIKLIIWFLGLPTSSPIRLSGLIYIIGLALWGIFVYVKEVYLQITLVIFTGIISFLFLTFVITLMFPPAKRIKNILDAYGDDPKIILFTAKEVKKWLEKVINYMEKQPNPKDIKEAIEPPLISNRLEKLQKRFLKSSSANRLKGRIEKKGNYLNALISGVSESLQISPESIEELINSKVDVNQKIGKEIIISYDQIEGNIKDLEDAMNMKTKIDMKAEDVKEPKEIIDSCNRIIGFCQRKINERIEYLESKKKSLDAQIKWIKEVDKRKGDIPTLLEEIIKEPSTGKAVSNLARLLSKKAETVEDLIWLIQFANSRKGYKISELLGLKVIGG